MALTVGSRLGHYDVTALIGEGGMGRVYRATDTQLGRDVALKILPDAFAADPDRLARFQREAQVLASLNHPGIAAIYGIEKSDDTQALVLELVEGPTLADRIAKGPIPLDEALPIAKQIAEALEAAHEAGVIHRDLKPANIKVREDGTVKVLDFGLAKALDTTPEGDPSQSPTLTAAATQMGVILGTAAYMSPEQARGKPVDRRADIWAFGAVLFEMLAGKRAFDGRDVSETLGGVLRLEPEWDALAAGIPPWVVALLRRCLNKEPRQRVQAMGDVRLAMEGSFDALVGQAIGPPKEPRRPRWRHPALGWLVAAVVAAGGFVVRMISPPAEEVSGGVVRYATVLMPDSVEWPGSGRSVAVAPDGRTLVFVLSPNRIDTQLHHRPIDAPDDPVPIPGSEGAEDPFLSPDGQSVAFFRDGELQRLSIYGGRATTICPAVDGAGGIWGADDTIIIGSTSGGLMRVTAVGGTPEPLTSVDSENAELGHTRPVLLPGGDAVLFAVLKGSIEQSHIAAVGLAGGSHTFVVDGYGPLYASSGHLVYQSGEAIWAAPFDTTQMALSGNPSPIIDDVRLSPGDQLAQYALAADGTLVFAPETSSTGTRLAWVDHAGVVTDRSEVIPELFNPSVSPTGDHLAFSQPWGGAGAARTSILDLQRRVPERINFEGTTFGAVWSPGGRQFVFGGDPGGAWETNLFLAARSGGELTQLTFTDYLTVPTSWSRDGRFLAYVETAPDTGDDIWTLPMDDDREPQPFLSGEYDETQPAIAPSGRLIAYRTNESGLDEVYVGSFPEPGIQRQVSVAGGMEPRWSPDGRLLYYRSGTHMMSVTVDDDPELQLGAPEVLFADNYRGFGNLRNAGYDVTPDGRFLMVERDEPDRLRTSVVFGFFEELERVFSPTD